MISRERKGANVAMTEPIYSERSRWTNRGTATIAVVPILLLTVVFAIPAVPGFFHAPATATSPTSVAVHPAIPLPIPTGVPADFKLPAGAGLAHSTAGIPSLRPGPSAGPSSSANFALTGSDCSTFGIYTPYEPTGFASNSIAQVGASNSTLVVAGGSIQGLFNNSGTLCNGYSPSGYFLTHGATSIYRSTDAGHSWSTQYLGQNVTHWKNSADPSNDSYNWGNAQVVSDNAGHLVLAEMSIPACWAAACDQSSPTSNVTNDWGIAASYSSDGGVTWSTPIQISAYGAIQWQSGWSTTCQTAGFTNTYYYENIPELPSIAINPVNGVVIVTWDVFSTNLAAPSNCDPNAGSAQVHYALSTDFGHTFGTVKGLSGALSEGSHVTIGAAPTYPITVTFADFQNQSSSAVSWEATRSTNNGTSWSTPHDVMLDGLAFVSGSGYTSFGVFSLPQSMAADTHAASPNFKHQYMVWADNATGVPSIGFSRSTDDGSSWSAPVTIVSSSGSPIYFMPAVAVSPDGTVWVTFYADTPSTGTYNLYGVLSFDGGTTWSKAFVVTDSLSAGSGLLDLGTNTAAVATTNGLYPLWTDCRFASCSSNSDVETWTANVHTVLINSTAPIVTANVTSGSSTLPYSLPVTLGWDNASTHTVQVPQYANDPSDPTQVFEFAGWSGLSTSTSFSTSVTFTGAASVLTAVYNQVPAAILEGTFAPNVAGATLKINNVVQPLTVSGGQLSYMKTVPSGLSYTLLATAPAYQSSTVQVPTTGGGIYWNNFTLVKQLGNLSGTLQVPSGVAFSAVTLTVNGTASFTVNPTTGFFTAQEPWGWYWVNASGSGLTGFSQYYQVIAAATTPVGNIAAGILNLSGGWISGTVTYTPGMIVKLDEVPIGVDPITKTFNQSALGGFHNLTATAPGYNLSQIRYIYVVPGVTTSVAVSITNQGWINGAISPVGAIKSTTKLHIYNASAAIGGFYPVGADGSFNVTLVGNHNFVVNVTAAGYDSYQTTQPVSPGNGTYVTIDLNVSTGCTSNCNNQQNCTTDPTLPGCSGTTTTPAGGLTTTQLLVIVAVIVLIAIVLAVVMMRRRGGSGGGSDGDDADAEPAAAPPPPAPYDESNP